MPFIKSLASKHAAYYSKLVAVILLLSKIIPIYSYCVEKGLMYIAIIALLSCQPFFCIKCTKLNIHSSCDIRLVFDAKYIFLAHLYIL